jgi:PAS domain S-box-containing protein
MIPLVGEDGSVAGMYNPAFERTRSKIAERRMLTLREIGEKTASAREVPQFWRLLIEGLEYNEYDAPLVLVYSLKDEGSDDGISTDSNTIAQSRQCVLEGTLGVAVGHPAAPQQIDLKSSAEGFGPAFRQAMKADKPILLSEEDASLDTSMLQGIQWRGFKDPSRTVVVCSIRPTTGESTLGFLVMGINPRRPYDQDYALFVQLLSRQLASSIASVVLFEEEKRISEQAAKVAAQDRDNLSTQLAVRTQEAMENEKKFTRMAELAPVGIFVADSQGALTYCNDTWYEISKYPRTDVVGTSWMNAIRPEDLPRVEVAWQTMLVDKMPVSLEFRFKHAWHGKNDETGDTWVLASVYPEKGPDNELWSIFGSITDISIQKFAENLQKCRLKEAMELKRQQESFMDITSHEIRNPLSAIVQCADGISMTLSQMSSGDILSQARVTSLESCIDASQTITLCARHQKRILDDVLTLSKLDSAMLLVTPVDVQPTAVAQTALKMFEGELKAAEIALNFQVDETLGSLQIDWVRLDPSRLLQVLINLLTNAIKFTTGQETRSITVHLAASSSRPSGKDRQTIKYVPTRNKTTTKSIAAADWGVGAVVYIHFAVQDTGRGLSESAKGLLFQRFSQASPRTHVTYGGSGLGLFISRELVELHGGEIGVASETERGSTFAFYIEARRSSVCGEAAADVSDRMQRRKQQLQGAPPNTSGARLNGTAPIASSPANTSSSTPTTEPLHILIVEDNLINQRVLAAQLQKTGCKVHVANHGDEALERIKRSRFWEGCETNGLEIDVVLMDLEMPVMDGLTCVRRIRGLQLEGLLVRHVPVMAVTANAREEQIRGAIGAGMVGPFSLFFLSPFFSWSRVAVERCRIRGEADFCG